MKDLIPGKDMAGEKRRLSACDMSFIILVCLSSVVQIDKG